jgi:hypothetical protein
MVFSFQNKKTTAFSEDNKSLEKSKKQVFPKGSICKEECLTIGNTQST